MRKKKKKRMRMRTSINAERTKALRDNEKQQKCAVNNKARGEGKQGKIDRGEKDEVGLKRCKIITLREISRVKNVKGIFSRVGKRCVRGFLGVRARALQHKGGR